MSAADASVLSIAAAHGGEAAVAAVASSLGSRRPSSNNSNTNAVVVATATKTYEPSTIIVPAAAAAPPSQSSSASKATTAMGGDSATAADDVGGGITADRSAAMGLASLEANQQQQSLSHQSAAAAVRPRPAHLSITAPSPSATSPSAAVAAAAPNTNSGGAPSVLPYTNPLRPSSIATFDARYELLEQIGRGSFSTVWRARARRPLPINNSSATIGGGVSTALARHEAEVDMGGWEEGLGGGGGGSSNSIRKQPSFAATSSSGVPPAADPFASSGHSDRPAAATSSATTPLASASVPPPPPPLPSVARRQQQQGDVQAMDEGVVGGERFFAVKFIAMETATAGLGSKPQTPLSSANSTATAASSAALLAAIAAAAAGSPKRQQQTNKAAAPNSPALTGAAAANVKGDGRGSADGRSSLLPLPTPSSFNAEEAEVLALLAPHESVLGIVDVFYSRTECAIVTEFIGGGEVYSHVARGATAIAAGEGEGATVKEDEKSLGLANTTANHPERQMRLTERGAQVIMRDLLAAIAHLHAAGVCHRDVKLENMLFRQPPPTDCAATDNEVNDSNSNETNSDESYRIKLIDFGFSKRIGNTRPLRSCCGSPNYMPPEMLRAARAASAAAQKSASVSSGLLPLPTRLHQQQGGGNAAASAPSPSATYGKEVDLWSAGVVLYVLAFGTYPFYDARKSTWHRKIMAGDYALPPSTTFCSGTTLVTAQSPASFSAVAPSAELVHLLGRLLDIDPLRRATAAEALAHPWLAPVTVRGNNGVSQQDGMVAVTARDFLESANGPYPFEKSNVEGVTSNDNSGLAVGRSHVHAGFCSDAAVCADRHSFDASFDRPLAAVPSAMAGIVSNGRLQSPQSAHPYCRGTPNGANNGAVGTTAQQQQQLGRSPMARAPMARSRATSSLLSPARLFQQQQGQANGQGGAISSLGSGPPTASAVPLFNAGRSFGGASAHSHSQHPTAAAAIPFSMAATATSAAASSGIFVGGSPLATSRRLAGGTAEYGGSETPAAVERGRRPTRLSFSATPPPSSTSLGPAVASSLVLGGGYHHVGVGGGSPTAAASAGRDRRGLSLHFHQQQQQQQLFGDSGSRRPSTLSAHPSRSGADATSFAGSASAISSSAVSAAADSVTVFGGGAVPDVSAAAAAAAAASSSVASSPMVSPTMSKRRVRDRDKHNNEPSVPSSPHANNQRAHVSMLPRQQHDTSATISNTSVGTAKTPSSESAGTPPNQQQRILEGRRRTPQGNAFTASVAGRNPNANAAASAAAAAGGAPPQYPATAAVGALAGRTASGIRSVAYSSASAASPATATAAALASSASAAASGGAPFAYASVPATSGGTPRGARGAAVSAGRVGAPQFLSSSSSRTAAQQQSASASSNVFLGSGGHAQQQHGGLFVSSGRPRPHLGLSHGNNSSASHANTHSVSTSVGGVTAVGGSEAAVHAALSGGESVPLHLSPAGPFAGSASRAASGSSQRRAPQATSHRHNQQPASPLSASRSPLMGSPAATAPTLSWEEAAAEGSGDGAARHSTAATAVLRSSPPLAANGRRAVSLLHSPQQGSGGTIVAAASVDYTPPRNAFFLTPSAAPTPSPAPQR